MEANSSQPTAVQEARASALPAPSGRVYRSYVIPLWLTFATGVVGIVAILAALAFTVLAFHSATNPGATITPILGAVTGVIGTIVGFVAGQIAGALGKQQEQQQANAARAQLAAVLDEAPPGALAQAKDKYPELFS